MFEGLEHIAIAVPDTDAASKVRVGRVAPSKP